MPPRFFRNISFSIPSSILATPSVSLRMTLPVKPSQTTTSTSPFGTSRGSMLPTKRMPGMVLRSWWASLSIGRALALLRAVVGQRHAGGGAALHLVHIAAAHDGEGSQHLGAALHIRAAVQQQVGLILGRHHGGQRRALDAPQGADDKACAHMERAGAAGRDECVAPALLQQVQAHDDGGVLLGADGPGRLVAHLDDLSAVDQLDAVQRDVVVRSSLADKGLIAHADELDAILLDSCGCALQHSQRGVVAAHHIHDDLHRFCLPSCLRG